MAIIQRIKRSANPGGPTSKIRPAILTIFFLSLVLWPGIFAPGGPDGAMINAQSADINKSKNSPGPGDNTPRIALNEKFKGLTLRNIKDGGEIVVGLQEDYQPFHIKNPRPGYPGIDAELAALLAKALGVEVRFVYHPLPELLRAVSQGKIHLSLGGVSSTMNRSRGVHFSEPYLVTTAAGLLARAALPPVSEGVDFPRRSYNSLGDLKYLGVLGLGVKKNTTNELLLREEDVFHKHKLITFENREKLYAALLDGDIDVLIGDGVYINSLVLKNPALLSKFVPLTKTYREEHICMALSHGDTEFWNYLNFFIREVKRTGEMKKILKKYFNSNEWIKQKD